MPDHDVAIIGAGPVGLLLACLLAARGVDVAVFEAREGVDDRSRAIGIHPPGQAALDAAGIGAQVGEEALALDGGEVICDGRVLILPQHRTAALLRQRLSRLREGALNQGRRVTRVHDEGDVVGLSFEDVPDITASFVVAADGVRSGIRRQLGIGWRQRPGSGWYAMVDFPGTGVEPRAQLHCERDGLVESFPLADGGRRWVVSDPRRALGEATAFSSAIRGRTGIRLELPGGMQPTLFRAGQHRATRLVAGRIVLIGDAAHETSPIGGQGMNLGWAAAVRLAPALERSLRRDHPDFADYERRTLRAAARAQRRSFFYMTMGRPARGPALFARNTLIRTLGTRPLRARAADMITMRGG